jgi:predicted PurR-regulated permease PerM
MNHFLTHVASLNPNDPPTLSGRTFGEEVEFKQFEFTIEVLPELPQTQGTSAQGLLEKYKKPNEGSGAILQNFIDKFRAGISSIMEEGINFSNSAQIIVFATIGIILIFAIFIFTILFKLLKRRSLENSLHSTNGLYSQ